MEATLRRVREAAPLIRTEAAASEAAGGLTKPVVEALRDCGVFRMTMSRELGGPELSPLEQIEVLEALSAADGSAGWCGMINSDGGYLTSFLERDIARQLYPSLDLATCALISPGGQAVVQGDGYVLSGDCTFGSGSSHADWFFLNCFVMDDNGLRFPPGGGMPETRCFAVPATQVEVLDTWHSTGLRGTASHDVRVQDVTVPAERSFSIFDGQAADPSPLYRWRWMFFVNMIGVPLGVARGAIEEAKQVAGNKIVLPAMTLARDDPTLQGNVGLAEATLGSARAYAFDTVGTMWESLCAGDLPSQAQWTAYRLALTHAFHSAKQAVTLVYESLGTTGVFARSPLDRAMRDVTTMAQHILAQSKTYANAGRSLLGLEPGGLAF